MESLEITDFSRFRTIYNGKNMVYLKKKNCIGVKMQNDQLVSENIFINKTLFCFRAPDPRYPYCYTHKNPSENATASGKSLTSSRIVTSSILQAESEI